MKYDATTDPKRDSISFMRISHGINSAQKLKNSRFIYLNFYATEIKIEQEREREREREREIVNEHHF
jgi:hypothetical protein